MSVSMIRLGKTKNTPSRMLRPQHPVLRAGQCPKHDPYHFFKEESLNLQGQALRPYRPKKVLCYMGYNLGPNRLLFRCFETKRAAAGAEVLKAKPARRSSPSWMQDVAIESLELEPPLSR